MLVEKPRSYHQQRLLTTRAYPTGLRRRIVSETGRLLRSARGAPGPGTGRTRREGSRKEKSACENGTPHPTPMTMTRAIRKVRVGTGIAPLPWLCDGWPRMNE